MACPGPVATWILLLLGVGDDGASPQPLNIWSNTRTQQEVQWWLQRQRHLLPPREAKRKAKLLPSTADRILKPNVPPTPSSPSLSFSPPSHRPGGCRALSATHPQQPGRGESPAGAVSRRCRKPPLYLASPGVSYNVQ